MIKLKQLLNEQSSDTVKWYKSLPKTKPDINYGDAYNYMLKYAGKQGSKMNASRLKEKMFLIDKQ